MNLQQASERLFHIDTTEGVIKEVTEYENSFTISLEDGCGFGIAKPVDKTPEVSQTITLYLFQGSGIQGIDLDGEPLFYKSKSDLEVERQAQLQLMETKRAEHEVKFAAELADPRSDFNKRLHRLPKVFHQRFKKFFRLGEDFWGLAWYELFACETAVKIAYTCKSGQVIQRFRNRPWAEQILQFPSLDEMSGNQVGFTFAVAKVYLRDSKLVRKVPGAMSPVTGSKPYIGR